jgi:hypothetical protein
MNIVGGDPRPKPTLVELAASMSAWARFLSVGESESVRPVGIEFSTEGINVTLSKLKTVTEEGTPEEIGRIVVSDGQLEEVIRWSSRAVRQLLAPEFDEGDRAPFLAVMDTASRIDSFVTAETLDFFTKGTVTPGEIRFEGSLSLVEIIRTTGNKADGDVTKERVAISGDRLSKVRALKESIERGSGETWESERLERNLQTVEEEVRIEEQIATATLLGDLT